jgi:hypothetical protein
MSGRLQRSTFLNPEVCGGLALFGIVLSAIWTGFGAFNISRGNMAGLVFDVLGLVVSVGSTAFQFRLLNTMKEKDDGLHWRTSTESYIGPAGRGNSRSDADHPAPAEGTGTEPTCRGISAESSSLVIGEVEAFRGWRVIGDYLASDMGAIWIPDKPMIGVDVGLDNTNGVHSFKSYQDAVEYYKGRLEPYAIGKIKMWGEIAEHQIGYRAQFAKPLEILLVKNGASASALSSRYRLGEKK